MPQCLRDLYEPAYRGVFRSGRQWVLDYECSSDVVYRLFRMTVIKRPEDDFILENVAFRALWVKVEDTSA